MPCCCAKDCCEDAKEDCCSKESPTFAIGFSFIVILAYWILEGVLVIATLSLGVGVAQVVVYLLKVTLSYKVDNCIQTYLTLYVLAVGVMAQTNFNLYFVDSCFRFLQKETKVMYCIFKTWAHRVLLLLAFLQLFFQFQRRYEAWPYDVENRRRDESSTSVDEMRNDDEDVTWKFLLALIFIAYSLGMKARRDYRAHQIKAQVPFLCPGILKYCAVFTVLYMTEFALLLIWGSPIVLLSILFRYYIFQPLVTYIVLIVLGILIGRIASIFERTTTVLPKLFRNHSSYPSIHGEVRYNILMYTMMPLIARWYFRIQVQFEDFETSVKSNSILFSVNVSFLLLYFVKFVFIYRFKMSKLGKLRRIRIFDIRPAPRVIPHRQHVPRNHLVRHVLPNPLLESSSDDDDEDSTESSTMTSISTSSTDSIPVFQSRHQRNLQNVESLPNLARPNIIML